MHKTTWASTRPRFIYLLLLLLLLLLMCCLQRPWSNELSLTVSLMQKHPASWQWLGGVVWSDSNLMNMNSEVVIIPPPSSVCGRTRIKICSRWVGGLLTYYASCLHDTAGTGTGHQIESPLGLLLWQRSRHSLLVILILFLLLIIIMILNIYIHGAETTWWMLVQHPVSELY